MRATARVLFRTDGGPAIGLGHVSRCLALADALRGRGAECHFLLDGDGRAVERALAAGFAASMAAGCDPAVVGERARAVHADALVIDSYRVTAHDLGALRRHHRPVVVLDDTAERELAVDVVVNGSVAASTLPYRGAADTRFLLGPRYLPLGTEFAEPATRDVRERVERILVTVGGGDPDRLTERLIRGAVAAVRGVALDVVVGPLFDDVDALRAAARGHADAIVLHENPKAMRALMLGVDLAITGGGQTVYELAATGTPAVGLCLADNQRPNLRGLDASGALAWVGDAGDPGLDVRLAGMLAALDADRTRRAAMSERGRALVDGRGAARIAGEILGLAGRG